MKSLLRLSFAPLLVLAACGSDDRAAEQPPDPDPAASTVPESDLRAAAGDSAAAKFYERNGWRAAWSDEGARALQQELAQRDRHGLDRLGFLPDGVPSSLAERETTLTEAALTYAAALAHGVTDPTELYEVYTVPLPESDLVGGLQRALSEGNLAAWLEGLAPQDREYAALSQAYRSYRQSAGNEPEDISESGGLIHQGESDPRVPAIRQRLRSLGYLTTRSSSASRNATTGDGSAQESGSGQRFTADLSSALRAFQRDNDIQVDGVVGAGTLSVLNRGPADRARAIAVALERRRWLERSPPGTRIDVNTGDATLEYFRDGSLVDMRKVVVGQPGKETPQLQAPMFRLVANPTWTVPRSIENTELAGVGPDYLRRHNMVRRDGWIVQLPGPENSLGLVKFDLQNDHAIYLHDTPAKSLFDMNVRQQSHGCVRVQDALGFAEMLASDAGIADQWRSARQKRDEAFVRLPEQLPVRLLYHPTFASSSGEIVFRQDIYGWNQDLAVQLGFDKRTGRRIYAAVDDLGP